VGRHEVKTIGFGMGWSGAKRIEHQNFVSDEPTVKSIGYGVNTQGSRHKPEGTDGFATVQGKNSDASRAKQSDNTPE
jgi:hypothetical protein